MVDPLIVVQVVAGSNPVSHPRCNPQTNRRQAEPQASGGFSLPASPAPRIPAAEMRRYIRRARKLSRVRPRTFWFEYSYYTVTIGDEQRFHFGVRPQDLAHLESIRKREWERHQAYLERLEQFPLDKADYYVRMRENYAINTVRGLGQLTGEDWSKIAKLLRILDLPDAIKDYLRNHKDEPEIVEFFTLNRLLDIVRSGNEREQLYQFRKMMYDADLEVGLVPERER